MTKQHQSDRQRKPAESATQRQGTPQPVPVTHRKRPPFEEEMENFLQEKSWKDLDEETYQDVMDEGLNEDEDGGMRRNENRGFGTEI